MMQMMMMSYVKWYSASEIEYSVDQKKATRTDNKRFGLLELNLKCI